MDSEKPNLGLHFAAHIHYLLLLEPIETTPGREQIRHESLDNFAWSSRSSIVQFSL